MVDPRNTRGAPPKSIRIERKKTNWLPWLALLLGLLALAFALIRHGREDAVVVPVPVATETANATPPVAVEQVTLPGGKTIGLAPATLNYELQRFLASSDPAPRTFTFDKLNFDTASSVIRTDDRPTLTALSQILAAYPKASVKLVGYADARGSTDANARLGEARAKSVATALTDSGIAANRIAAMSGGETNPVASNATAGGQFENRRTELVVTAK